MHCHGAGRGGGQWGHTHACRLPTIAQLGPLLSDWMPQLLAHRVNHKVGSPPLLRIRDLRLNGRRCREEVRVGQAGVREHEW